MSTTIEIAYYNTFILSGGEKPGDWHVEESRIKGGFNESSVDLGPKAYLVDDKYESRRRPNAMIYSGIYNARTNVNETNQFNISEDITKAVNASNGSIQKLYAEDTNLLIFQENKVNKALIDKDAIYTAEGSPLQASSNIVIGQIIPFTGKYGISKNPESFAVYGNRKYFTDRRRGIVLRLSQDGLTPISDTGMRKWFADNLKKARRIYGMYDEPKNKYILSLHNNTFWDTELSFCGADGLEQQIITGFYTLAFDESSKGWLSFYTYKPSFGFSLNNEFYTWPLFTNWEHNIGTNLDGIQEYSKNIDATKTQTPNIHNWRFFEHHSSKAPRCNWYSAKFNDPCSVQFVFNDEPNIVKNFSTIDYTGSDGWRMVQFLTNMDKAHSIKASTSPANYFALNTSKFKKKENKKVSDLRSDINSFWQYHYNLSEDQGPEHPHNSVRVIMPDSVSGVKGYFARTKFDYFNPSEGLPGTLSGTGTTLVSGSPKQELFSISTGVKTSSESTYL